MIHRERKTIATLDCTVVSRNGLVTPRAAVILCHGFGAPGTDLVAIGSEFISANESLADVVYIFPAGPLELDPGYDARAWWMIDMERIQRMALEGQSRDLKNEIPDRLAHCRKSMLEMMEEVQRTYALASQQIVIGGFSQGAMLTTDVALHSPQPLGGLIIWSGALINALEWTSLVQQQDNFPIIQSHGRFDPILPFSGAEELFEILKQAGFPIEFLPFSGAHTIPMEVLELASRLILEVVGQQ